MLNIKEGQKAKAIARYTHEFKNGEEITFLGMSKFYETNDVYTFEGLIDGEMSTQDLIEGEFELIKD